MKELYAIIDDDNVVIATASNYLAATRIISTSQLPPLSVKDKKKLRIVKTKKPANIGDLVKEEVTTGDVDFTPTTTPTSGERWRLFVVPGDVFRKFETGRNKFERWAKYLDMNDQTQLSLYNYAKKNPKHVIILKNSDNGALRSIRKRALNETPPTFV